MNKAQLNFSPSFFDCYINKVPDLDLRHAIRSLGLPIIEQHRDHWNALGNQIYAPGKWTINEIVQHIIDTERVFAFRALWMGRAESAHLPGFDQDLFNDHASAKNRQLSDLIKELILVRQSTIWLFDSMTDESLLREGTASNLKMNPLVLGYMITGHLLHHVQILEERYYPLLAEQS